MKKSIFGINSMAELFRRLGQDIRVSAGVELAPDYDPLGRILAEMELNPIDPLGVILANMEGKNGR
jgi:hypothetical protein